MYVWKNSLRDILMMRSFRVINLVINNKHLIVKDHNKYTSKYGPRPAASKAWTKYCNNLQISKACKGEIYLQDITPKSKQKDNIYAYKVMRVNASPGAYKRGKNGIIKFRYQNIIKSLNL